MGNKKDDLLEQMTEIPGLANKIRRGMRGVSGTLQKQGYRHKAMVEDVGSKIDEIKSMLSDDPDLADEILQHIISMHGGEPDGDEDMEMEDEADMEAEDDMEDAYMEAEDEAEDSKEAEDEEEDDAGMARKARRGRRGAQPGYQAPAQTGPNQNLANQAITKRPGTFPQPVTPQQANGTTPKLGKARRGKSFEQQVLTAIKSIGDRLNDLEEAMGEAAVMQEQVKELADARTFFPHTASQAPETMVTDEKLIKGVKQVLKVSKGSQFDPFWGTAVGPTPSRDE